ncbi:rCG38034 [Rattus norvegicus]|uniref:RCG38034 n=1 Tax=Rattus norvegicus TaxID=10116 RepID=A6IV92_RAT|nr:rCG38034 [Rattus norvegicus]
MVCDPAFFINLQSFITMLLEPFFGTMVAICCFCFFVWLVCFGFVSFFFVVILSLNLVDTVFVQNLSGQPNLPYHFNAVPHPIPEKK